MAICWWHIYCTSEGPLRGVEEDDEDAVKGPWTRIQFL